MRGHTNQPKRTPVFGFQTLASLFPCRYYRSSHCNLKGLRLIAQHPMVIATSSRVLSAHHPHQP